MRTVLLLAMLAMLLSCGAGSGGDSPSIAGGGIGGTGISRGPISGFGSIFVNDTEFDTGSAVVFVNGVEAGTGDAAVAANFTIGKVVRVEGNFGGTSGNAARVVFNSDVRGPVESITVLDPGVLRLVVMGQPVIVDETTAVSGGNASDLATGNFVEVSGLVDASGDLRASFLDKLAETFIPGGNVEVEGLVRNPDPVAMQFEIGLASITYGSADLSGLVAGPADGQRVRVKGTYSAGILAASEITAASELGASNSQDVETQGFVSGIMSSNEFLLGMQSVRTSASTLYRGGVLADLRVGAKLQVEGSLSGGVISADEIIFKDSANIESRVESTSAGGLTLTGLPGLTVTVNSLTEIDGITNSIGGINAGNLAKVRGRISGSDANVLASKIEVENASIPTEVKLQGPVETIAEPFITVLGQVIDTSSTGFEDDSDQPIASTEFFNQVSVGDTVNAKGQLDAGGVLTWQEIELEGQL